MLYFTDKLCWEINDSDPEVVSRAERNWYRNMKAYEVQLRPLLRRFNKRNQRFWSDYVYHLHDGGVVRITVGDAVEADALKKVPKSWRTGALIDVIDWDNHMLCTLKYGAIEALDARLRDGVGWSSGTIFETWAYSELTAEGTDAFRHNILFNTGSEMAIVFKRFSYIRRRLPRSD